jgi:6-phosphogluconolactonase
MKTTPSGVVILPDPESVAREAAERFVSASAEAVAARGRFVTVLAGGSTPRALYGLLATPGFRERVAWDRIVVLFGDERSVGPDDPQSNYRMASDALLDHVPVGSDQIHRMGGEARALAEAAAVYAATVRGLYPGEAAPRLDLVLLGMGPDGHTASLFPGTAALRERSRWVVANHVPQLDTWRITMTYPALGGARRILFLITGADKAPVFAEAFGGAPHDAPHPSELVVPTGGSREVLADRAVASGARG